MVIVYHSAHGGLRKLARANRRRLKLISQLDVNDQGRCSVGVTAIVRITLQDGCFHEDVGAGQGENIKGKGAALDKVSFCLQMSENPADKQCRQRRRP